MLNSDPSTPLVSVIIPTFNRRHFIGDAIDSVLIQSYPSVELIVVDDGSTDGTAEWIESEYGSALRLLRRTQSSNAGAARNWGVSHSTGKLLAFLDSDDMWLSDKLASQVPILVKGGDGVSLVGSACYYVSEDGNEDLGTSEPPNRGTYEGFCIKVDLPGSGSNNLMRKSDFLEVGGFDEGLPSAEDKDLWIKLLRLGEVRYADRPGVKIRVHWEERKGRTNEIAFQCRRTVDKRIPEPHLRRRATAWTYASFARRLWPESPGRALAYLGISFVVSPTPVRRDLPRLRPFLSAVWNSLRKE